MSSKRIRIALLMAGLASLSAPAAWAVGLDVVGAGTYSMATTTPALGAAHVGGLGFPGGGLIVNFRMGAVVDFELGALYLTRTFNTSQTSSMIDGMGGFKFRLGRVFFVDLGGFYNYHLTDAITLTGSDYGAYGGLGLRIPMGSTTGLVIRGDYRYALSSLVYLDTATLAAGTTTPHEVVAFVGLSFGGGGGK